MKEFKGNYLRSTGFEHWESQILNLRSQSIVVCRQHALEFSFQNADFWAQPQASSESRGVQGGGGGS